MTIDEVERYFGSLYMVAKNTKYSHSTAYAWRRNGFIPIKTQMEIESLTKGALKANLLHCQQVIEEG